MLAHLQGWCEDPLEQQVAHAYVRRQRGSGVLRFRSRWSILLVAQLFALLMRLLFVTLRLKFRGVTSGFQPYEQGAPPSLFAIWHDSAVIPVFCGKQHGFAALTSRHQDGTFVEAVLKAGGIGAVRGSTGRGGVTATRRLMKLAQDKHIVITPDGPRGPRRTMSKGIVYLASRSGRVVYPTAFHAGREWRIKGNWTDLMIPVPFSRVYCLIGDPIEVPPDVASQDLDTYVDRLQAAMDRLDQMALRLAQGLPIEDAGQGTPTNKRAA